MPTSNEHAALVQFLCENFSGLEIVSVGDDNYIFYDPDRVLSPQSRMPFVTIMTDDANDTASKLTRPGVYRLNLGLYKETYRAKFGPQPATPKEYGIIDTGHDYTQLDVLMPHPIYSPMSWACVLNPSPATLEALLPLLRESYDLAVQRHDKKRAGLEG